MIPTAHQTRTRGGSGPPADTAPSGRRYLTIVADPLCVPNIGAAQSRRRLWPGVASVALGVGHGIAVWALSLTPALLIPAGVLLFAGFTGVFQAREKT